MIVGGTLISASIPMLIGPLWLRAKRRPFSSLTRLFESAERTPISPLSQQVFDQAVDVLPRLTDPTCRKITVTIMNILAKIRAIVPENEQERCDAWLSTSLDLALSAQIARDSRSALKQTTSDFFRTRAQTTHEHVVYPSDSADTQQNEQSQLSQQETHSLTMLLQIRARVERLLASLQMTAADRQSPSRDIDQAMTELDIHIETIRDMSQFGPGC